ncbi:hypothetical protein [Rhizobium leguminosarum]|uniref:hypothetical protein n=1 Tax=Rhizobium leguminosarum TaxID=384 RepID=UPI002484D2D9|nr:hypothetical protein [Rhizobium leguminosarum]
MDHKLLLFSSLRANAIFVGRDHARQAGVKNRSGICALRRLGLAHTRLADATCGTIRLKLLKIGAQVRVSVRRNGLSRPLTTTAVSVAAVP